MKTNNNRIVLLLLACVLAACGGNQSTFASSGGAIGTPPAITQDTQTTLYGPLTEAEAALLGPDKDRNGVRDDVDAWITATFLDAPTQSAATVNAQWFTWRMLKGIRHHTTTVQELNGLAAADICLYRKADVTLGKFQPSGEQWEARIFNTRARTRAYLDWDASTSGMVDTVTRHPCEDVIAIPVP